MSRRFNSVIYRKFNFVIYRKFNSVNLVVFELFLLRLAYLLKMMMWRVEF